MAKSGDVQNPASPPFATSDGKPMAPKGGAGNGAHDFVKSPTTGSAPGGGRDFTKESRPQSEADPRGAGNPNTQDIPAGGKDLKADPSATGQAAGGQGGGVMGVSKTPFKGLK